MDCIILSGELYVRQFSALVYHLLEFLAGLLGQSLAGTNWCLATLAVNYS